MKLTEMTRACKTVKFWTAYFDFAWGEWTRGVGLGVRPRLRLGETPGSESRLCLKLWYISLDRAKNVLNRMNSTCLNRHYSITCLKYVNSCKFGYSTNMKILYLVHTSYRSTCFTVWLCNCEIVWEVRHVVFIHNLMQPAAVIGLPKKSDNAKTIFFRPPSTRRFNVHSCSYIN